MIRAWEAVRGWVEDTFHLHWVNEAFWRWEDRRRAVRLDELASLADSAGMADSAAKARDAAARARLRAS